VLDGSALRLPAHDPFAFDGRGLRPYNSGPHGMLLGVVVHGATPPAVTELASAASPPARRAATPTSRPARSTACARWPATCSTATAAAMRW
jgi:D-alanyl-D-alanine carboxypeptidase/D-alanyl-D-alanine-endopeptidase (penicillin-binding protein 4)